MVAGVTSSERKTVRRRSEVTYFKAHFAKNLLIEGGDIRHEIERYLTPQERSPGISKIFKKHDIYQQITIQEKQIFGIFRHFS